MTESVILAGARTPIGRLQGALAPLTAVELGAVAIREAIQRSGVLPTAVEHVVMGMVLQAGAGQIPARQAAFRAGLASTVTAEVVNRVCGSGMRSIAIADLLIRAGHHRVVVAGGMESMSNAPYALAKARGGYRMGDGVLQDLMVYDGLYSAIDDRPMGEHGAMVAAEEGVSREEQDAYALRSHRRYFAALEAGHPQEEIVPVEVPGRKGAVTVVDRDESPRADTSAEALASLPTAFGPDSTITAGNAPGVNDGAAAVVVADADWAREQGLTPLATIRSTGSAAWEVPYLAWTPELAAWDALRRAGLEQTDIDLWELNEAFSSVPIIAARRLGVSEDRVNIDGGSVALGHPIGMSGTRITLALALQLRRAGGGRGVAAICSGGGQGDAIVLEVAG
jgi:acetyl-CoA C-acetyltransferase